MCPYFVVTLALTVSLFSFLKRAGLGRRGHHRSAHHVKLWWVMLICNVILVSHHRSYLPNIWRAYFRLFRERKEQLLLTSEISGFF